MGSTALPKLNRFTTLPILTAMLREGCIRFGDPRKWTDESDAEALDLYRRKRSAERIYALCFLREDETIHHWSAYARGLKGCCVEFDAKALLHDLRQAKGVRCGRVIYPKERHFRTRKFHVRDVPFLKPYPYRYEKEFRAIWTGASEEKYYPVSFRASCIRKVTVNKDLPDADLAEIQAVLAKAGAVARVNRSSILRRDSRIDYIRRQLNFN